MPGMDGWAVLSALKADPDVADIPVVMLTIVDDRNLGYALGASDYLTKPIDRERLATVLKQHRRDRPVLVVDDDADVRQLLRRMLEPEGYTVVEAENGRAALERLRDVSPSVVLLDLMMPEMDGFEFVAEFRRHEAWRAIPIVVITAKDLSADDRERLNGYVAEDPPEGRAQPRAAAGRGARAGGDQRRPPEAEGLMAKILLVEDNEMNRDMLSRRLVTRGYEVAIAVDGEQGVAMARSEAPALILMDMSLPGIDGWEATRQLKADPETQPDSRHRAHRPRHGRRPREGHGGGLRRLRHQARRAGPAAREDRGAARPGRPAREHRPRRAAPPRAAHAAEPHHRLRRDAAGGARRTATSPSWPPASPPCAPTRASSWPC